MSIDALLLALAPITRELREAAISKPGCLDEYQRSVVATALHDLNDVMRLDNAEQGPPRG